MRCVPGFVGLVLRSNLKVLLALPWLCSVRAELFHAGHSAVHTTALQPTLAHIEHARMQRERDRGRQHFARIRKREPETFIGVSPDDFFLESHSQADVFAPKTHEMHDKLHRHPGRILPAQRRAAALEIRGEGLGERSFLSEEDEQKIKDMTTELTDCRSEYTGIIGVGTDKSGDPLVKARVVFDTGSTNLWVISSLCDFDCDADQRSGYFNPEASVSQEEPPRRGDIDILFGTGEISGPLARDVIQVGPVRVRSQPFGLIRNMTGSVFRSFQFEGILGLGFKSLSFEGLDTFLDQVIAQKVLHNNEFSFFLNSDSTKPSAILWGGVDSDLFEGPIRMFNVSKPHYWSLNLLDMLVGDMSVLAASADRPTQLIVDTGTTFFTAPTELKAMIVDQMPPRACREVGNYPNLTYVLQAPDGKPFSLVITQETYMIGSEEGACEPAFMALDVNRKWGPAMILGEVFMRHFFTTFSRGDGVAENAKIGFAPVRPGATPRLNKHDELPRVEDKRYEADTSKAIFMRREKE